MSEENYKNFSNIPIRKYQITLVSLAKLWSKLGAHAHIWAYVFLAEIFRWCSGTIIYWLPIGFEKSKLASAILIFFGPLLVKNRRGHHASPWCSGSSKLNQKVGPLGGLFGSTVILNSCFQKIQALMIFDIVTATN